MIPTPFDLSGDLTPYSDEMQFWDDLVADSPRVRIDQIGTSVGGLPLLLVGIGYPVAPPLPEDAEMESMLVMGYQHGHEPAGREGTIKFVQEMAYTTDVKELEYLNKHPVWVIPAVNPDRAPLGETNNLNWVNINRDHVKVTQPETQIVHETVRRLRPHVVVDMHEGAGSGLDIGIGLIDNERSHADVVGLSYEMRDFSFDWMQALGQVWAPWPPSPDPWMMRNAGGLRHAVSILAETNMTGQKTYAQRIFTHVEHLRSVIAFHGRESSRIAAAVGLSRAEKMVEGEVGTTPFFVPNEINLDPPPLGYRLTMDQYEQCAPGFAADGVYSAQDGVGWVVPMAQHAQPTIPFMLDADSRWRMVEGERLYSELDIPAFVPPARPAAFSPPPMVYPGSQTAAAFGPLHFNGVRNRVTSVAIRLGGSLNLIWEE